MKTFLTVLTLCLAGLCAPLSAQTHNWRVGSDTATTVSVEFAQDYELANERFLTVHFAVQVPFVEAGATTRTRGMPEGNVYELLYTDSEGKLLEYMTIATGTVEADTPEAQQEALYNVITQFVYPSIEFEPEAEVLGGRRAIIAGQPALEFMAISDVEGQDAIVARIVGVVSPNGVDALFFIQQTARDRMRITAPDEMSQTYAGRVPDTVSFMAYRNADNAVVPF